MDDKKAYVSQEYGYTFEYPVDWKVHVPEDESSRQVRQTYVSKTIKDEYGVSVLIEEGLTAESFLARLQSMTTEDINQEPFVGAGYPAKVFRYKVEPFIIESVLLSLDSGVAVITNQRLPEDSGAAEGLKLIAHSLKVLR
jgi:hypothetical protein